MGSCLSINESQNLKTGTRDQGQKLQHYYPDRAETVGQRQSGRDESNNPINTAQLAPLPSASASDESQTLEKNPAASPSTDNPVVPHGLGQEERVNDMSEKRLSGRDDNNQVPVANNILQSAPLSSSSANDENQTLEENPVPSRSTDIPVGFHGSGQEEKMDNMSEQRLLGRDDNNQVPVTNNTLQSAPLPSPSVNDESRTLELGQEERAVDMSEQRLSGRDDNNQVPVTNNSLTPIPVKSTSGNGEDLAEGFHEWIERFNDIKAEKDIDALILQIEKLLQKKMSIQQNNPVNDSASSQEPQQMEEERLNKSFTKVGSKFVKYINGLVDKKGFHRGIKTTAEILKEVAKLGKSTLGWLSIIGYLLSTFEKGIDNQTESSKLLRSMIELAKHVQQLKNRIPEEKFNNAIELIVEGSITCYSQLKSQMVLRTLIATVNSEALSSIQKDIDVFIRDLHTTLVIGIDERIPRPDPPKKPVYPRDAVGIEKPVEVVLGSLKATENSSVAVVIYGCGGIGKSIVAKAVVAEMDLSGYNYTFINIYEEQEKNKIKKLQQQILKYCFPAYKSGIPTIIRTAEQGRDELVEAFKCEKNKPIFLFIDNVFRSHDLIQLLPQDLEGLPQGSRILMTTRTLAATDMFKQHLVWKSYPLQPLADEDALKILFKDSTKLGNGNIEPEYLKRIITICSGVPLALQIVRNQLYKSTSLFKRCDLLLDLLEEGDGIRADNLTDRLFDFVYGELEVYTKEAFLDICCFSLSNWKLQDVEYIVGEQAVISLLETGLIRSTAKQEDSDTMHFGEEFIVLDIIAAKGRKLGEGNRIKSYKSFREAADEKKLGEIKGVWLIDDTPQHLLEEDELNLTRKSLRVLALGEGIKVSGASSENFEKLRFLHMGGSITQLPVKLEALDKLAVFHGPFSVEGEVSLCKLPSSLLAMKVREYSDNVESNYSEMEGALQCRGLEKLHFTGLRNLRKLPQESDRLHKLKTFILDDFSTMETLPEEICQLHALSLVSITNSSSLKNLPASFPQLTTLKQLRLSGLLAFEALPPTFSEFRDLTHLDLEGCSNLQTLPANFELPALTHLSLSGCKSLEALPQDFGYLTALKYLNLASCEKLRALPPTFGRLSALKHLRLRCCTMLQILSDNFGQLTALEYLDLCCCAKLEILPFDQGELTALKQCMCSPGLKDMLAGLISEEVLIVVH